MSVPSQRNETRPSTGLYAKMREVSEVKCATSLDPVGAIRTASPAAAGTQMNSAPSGPPKKPWASLRSRAAPRVATMRVPLGDQARL